nr:hypothetical protein GCM10025730_17670 [Promicromonospora thailandica]
MDDLGPALCVVDDPRHARSLAIRSHRNLLRCERIAKRPEEIPMRTDTPRRRWPVALLAVLAAVSTGGLVLLVAAGGPGVNHFRTAEGRAAYEEAYAAAMAGLPEPTATHDVATTFGTVRAYAWVDEEHPDATPVVLLPGRSAAVPMWADNLPDFARHRTVYAFDTLGDTGLSVQTLPLADVGDSARWVDEAMQALGIERAHLLGHSQGAAWRRPSPSAIRSGSRASRSWNRCSRWACCRCRRSCTRSPPRCRSSPRRGARRR